MRMIITLLLSLMLLVPTVTLAQQVNEDVEVGAGSDVNSFVSPGLESRSPRAITADEVPVMIPHDDQITGRVTIPDDKLGVLVQPEGRFWRSFRMEILFWIATAVILGTLALLAIFYFWRGRITLEHGRAGRWVPRFGAIERFAHWTTAISFLSLALTGLIITFGRFLLIPLIGHNAHNSLAQAAKMVHNSSALPFVLGVLMILVLWIKDNIPNRDDITWFRQAGGMFNKPGTPHPESQRFNAGQKLIFWSVTLGGIAISISGAVLMMPFFFTGVGGMQTAHVVHALLAVLLIAVIIAHIYIGTLGMEGAFDAMGRGEVDENWAKEHHRGWYDAQIRNAPRRERDGPENMPAE